MILFAKAKYWKQPKSLLLGTRSITVIHPLGWGFPGGSNSKGSSFNVGDLGSIPGSGGTETLEKGMATHSSTLAWKITWTEEPGRL